MDSIEKAGYNIQYEIKIHPDQMRHFVRCDDVDISAIAVDFFQNTLYHDVFFNTFAAVKQYCPVCKNIRK